MKVAQADSQQRCKKALELIKQKKYKEAISVLNLWMDKEYTEKIYGPDYKDRVYVHPLELFLEGGCEMKLNNIEAAQTTFGLCQSLHPKSHLCSLGLGELFKEKGNKTAALMYYRQAKELLPAYDQVAEKTIEKSLKELEQ